MAFAASRLIADGLSARRVAMAAGRCGRPGQRAAISLGHRAFAEDAQLARTVLHPPGANVDASKFGKFARLLRDALNDGALVELRPVGASAMWHSLRAFSEAKEGPGGSATFEAEWEEPDSRSAIDGGGGRQDDARRTLRILARRGLGARDDSGAIDLSNSSFVSNNTQALPLAQRISAELRSADHRGVLLQTYADAERAAGVILKALATARRLGDGRALRCSASSLQDPRNAQATARLVVRVHLAAAAAEEATTLDWVGWPPGDAADPAAIKRFARSVVDRLTAGQAVSMECRGPTALCHAVAALASLRGRTAEFEARWVDAALRPGAAAVGGRDARVLRLRAVSGEPWSTFNATDFSRTRLLRADDARRAVVPDVRALARSLGAEARERGGVALHVSADDEAAVSRAIKALASVPVETGGDRIVCIASFGRRKSAKASGEGEAGSDRSDRVLRLFARPFKV